MLPLPRWQRKVVYLWSSVEHRRWQQQVSLPQMDRCDLNAHRVLGEGEGKREGEWGKERVMVTVGGCVWVGVGVRDDCVRERDGSMWLKCSQSSRGGEWVRECESERESERACRDIHKQTVLDEVLWNSPLVTELISSNPNIRQQMHIQIINSSKSVGNIYII